MIQSRDYSFTHLFNPYLVSAYCVPGILSDARNTVVNRREVLNFMRLPFWEVK